MEVMDKVAMTLIKAPVDSCVVPNVILKSID